MKFVLIIYIVSGTHGAITSQKIEGFPTKEACEKAGEDYKDSFYPGSGMFRGLAYFCGPMP